MMWIWCKKIIKNTIYYILFAYFHHLQQLKCFSFARTFQLYFKIPKFSSLLLNNLPYQNILQSYKWNSKRLPKNCFPSLQSKLFTDVFFVCSFHTKSEYYSSKNDFSYMKVHSSFKRKLKILNPVTTICL